MVGSELLEAIVGAEFVRVDGDAVRVLPADAEETSAVMKTCSERGWVVSATGAGTKTGWGTKVRADVLLDVSRMRGVVEHSWGDLVATVGAGTPWAEMQGVLAEREQRVALDPVFAGRATVGGVLATNDSGVLRMRYGSLRDLVLGMTIVLADGTIARTGGKVVKNVAGYDLPKLLTGSFGTLGVITEATFRLHPVQAHSSVWTVKAGDVAALAGVMQRLVTAGMSIEAMQLRNVALGFELDVMFAALPEGLAEHEERLRGFAAGFGLEATVGEVFGAREELFRVEGATVLKVSALTTKLAAIVAGFAQLETAAGYVARAVADPVGIVTVALMAPSVALVSVVEDLRARLLGSGGTVVVLERGALPESVDAWGEPGAAIDVMRAIKMEFDAGRVLNPGKFVGGI